MAVEVKKLREMYKGVFSDHAGEQILLILRHAVTGVLQAMWREMQMPQRLRKANVQ